MRKKNKIYCKKLTCWKTKSKQLQEQIKLDQENARTEIANWCGEKKEEANLNAKRLAEEASEQGFQAGYEYGR